MGEVKPPDREARGGSPLASEVGHGETELEGDPASIECQEESDTFGGKDSSHNNMDGVVGCKGGDMGQRGGTTVVMQNDVVTRCGENNCGTLTPSSGSIENEKATATASAREDVKKEKCIMNCMRCVIHNCEVRKVKSSVKKWAYLDKKKKWGYKYSTCMKYICIFGGEVGVSASVSRPGNLTVGISRNFEMGGQNNSSTGLVRSENVERNDAT